MYLYQKHEGIYKPDGKSHAVFKLVYSSSIIKMEIVRFMLVTNIPESQEKHCFWIPVKKRSLWKAKPLCTAIAKDRALGHFSSQEGEQGLSTVNSKFRGTCGSSLRGLFINAKLFVGTSF